MEQTFTTERDRIGIRLKGVPRVALIAPPGAREELRAALADENLQLATFPDAEAFAAALGGPARDIALLWVQDSSTGLAERIEAVACAQPDARIIVVCPSIERWGVRTALVAGASGVIAEEQIEGGLAACVRAVLAEQICVPRAHRLQIEPPVLSGREKQVLGLVVMGYSNSAIAQQLFLAESTVKSHLSSAFGKLGVRSRNEAVDMILDADRGFGMGILALGGEPVAPASAA